MKIDSYILGSIWISFNPIKGETLYKRRNWSLFLFLFGEDDVHHFRWQRDFVLGEWNDSVWFPLISISIRWQSHISKLEFNTRRRQKTIRQRVLSIAHWVKNLFSETGGDSNLQMLNLVKLNFFRHPLLSGFFPLRGSPPLPLPT